MDKGKLIRQAALVALIVCDIAMLTFWALAGHWGFFWTFIGINVVVIAGEIINNFWWYGKTLSTEAKHKLQEGGKRRIYIYLAIVFLILSILALSVHLGVYW